MSYCYFFVSLDCVPSVFSNDIVGSIVDSVVVLFTHASGDGTGAKSQGLRPYPRPPRRQPFCIPPVSNVSESIQLFNMWES